MKRRELRGRQAEIYLLVIFLVLLISSNTYSFPYKDFDITIQGAIAEMYDDNITFSKDDKKEDFITTLTLNLGAKYEGKRRSLELTGSISHGFHTKFSDIKSTSEGLTLGFSNEFSKYDRMRLGYSFAHTQTPESFEEEFGRVRGRRDAYNNSLNFNYAKDINEYLAMNTSYSYSQSLFPEEGESNTSQHGLGLNVTYSPDFAFGYSLLFNYAKNNFGDAVYNAGINITKRIYISKKSFFTGGLGFSGSEMNNILININASFTNEEKIDEGTFTNITFNTSEQLSSEGRGVFRNWQINGQISREISWRSNGLLSVFYGQGTFSSTDITNTLLGVNVALSYILWEDLHGNLSYSYSNSNSTDETSGYTRNTVMLSLSKTF